MDFPTVRMRRLRKTPALRKLVNQTTIQPNNLIYPLFVDENIQKPTPITTMPGISRLPISQVTAEVRQVMEQDVQAVMLFGVPSKKDSVGSGAYAGNGVVQQAIDRLKAEFGEDLVVIGDVCLCEYTSHGHCGVLKNQQVQNDQTLKLLQETAVSQAQAGADMVAPSAMMDGQVQAIREALDDSGFEETAIMSYAVKYASSFYGPFREAAESAPQFGNRKSYQMGFGNVSEALMEADLDVAEGADVIMVKPALAYLDILSLVKEQFNVPIAAYNVSGEYSMIKAAAQNGWIDEKAAALETLTAMKRAGADLIVTYFARDVKKWLNQQQ
ncbi:MAG: porphobilinogen synthase [Candidatus Bathyarchaeota archaeon]|nr:porphobilinogen synthase [Candidatus Bathyarchaeota archaeon]